VVRLLVNVEYVALGPERTLLHLASPTFDASTLKSGERCCTELDACCIRTLRQPIQQLEEVIRDKAVDTLFLTTALFNLIVDEKVEILRNVKQVLTGGEASSPAHFSKAAQQLPQSQLIHVYGPTECTTFSSSYRVPQSYGADFGTVPIGRSDREH